MFNKKCPRCSKEVSKGFIFCPYCGCNIPKENESKDYGFLGVDDNANLGIGAGLPFNLNGILNSLMKQLSKEMTNIKPEKSSSISISISSDGKPMVRVNSNDNKMAERKTTRKSMTEFSPEQLEKFSGLPKREPKTNVRRLSQKILYEMDVPGVKNSKDVMISKLEKGIEIRALGAKAAYFKTINLGLELLNYKLAKEKLVLEFKA